MEVPQNYILSIYLHCSVICFSENKNKFRPYEKSLRKHFENNVLHFYTAYYIRIVTRIQFGAKLEDAHANCGDTS
jgi:hypothetical protein